jgi:hypothetical protein
MVSVFRFNGNACSVYVLLGKKAFCHGKKRERSFTVSERVIASLGVLRGEIKKTAKF